MERRCFLKLSVPQPCPLVAGYLPARRLEHPPRPNISARRCDELCNLRSVSLDRYSESEDALAHHRHSDLPPRHLGSGLRSEQFDRCLCLPTNATRHRSKQQRAHLAVLRPRVHPACLTRCNVPSPARASRCSLSTIEGVTGLATKHRPRRLTDLVGQRHVTAVLQKALQSHRVPHQLLFSGGSGLGKTTVARVVAAALLCENPVDGDACGVCESCLDIFEPSRSHPDVVEFDAASNGQKEQIRELAARALTSPVRGEHRVYIIDEAHGLSQGGGQAFLKLLEEPPAHVVFMLATTDPEKMLKTNRGRCVEFELARPSDEELAEHLRNVAKKESWELTEPAALAIVRATDPALGVRGLLMTLEKLQEALAWGEPLEIDDVTSLLGLPPASLIERLWAAVLEAEKNKALDVVAEIRSKVSDASLRKALVIRSREDLQAALAHGAGEIALWRFEQLLDAPAGSLWTDMVVAKIARTETPGDPVVVEALLRDALATARHLTATVEAPTEPRSPLELLAEAVTRRDAAAGELLAQCQLSIVEREDQQHAVRINAPDDVVAKLREHAQAVRDAAAECDLALLIAKN